MLLVLFNFIFVFQILPTESLWCYQCASVKEGRDCHSDVAGLNASALAREGRYAKDCSKQFVNQNSSTQYYCVIETHKKEGGRSPFVSLYIV